MWHSYCRFLKQQSHWVIVDATLRALQKLLQCTSGIHHSQNITGETDVLLPHDLDSNTVTQVGHNISLKDYGDRFSFLQQCMGDDKLK